MPWEALFKIFVENPSLLSHVMQKKEKYRAKPFAKDRNRVTDSVHTDQTHIIDR